MHPKDLSIEDFTYPLPEEKIARYPLPERDASRLLVYQEEHISEDIYRHVASHIPPGALLLFNNTKVVEARILFQKPTGGIIEIFCLEPHEQYNGIAAAMLQPGRVLWKCLVGGASKWKQGQILEKKITSAGKSFLLQARNREKREDGFLIELSWAPPALSFSEILHEAGAIPLPPYIKRETEAADAERYQTIYAKHEGSVAAPTAGLHFTKAIFDSLQQKNIQTDFVTLHVGAGTFKPVKSETMGAHDMHAEYIEVSRATIENILAHPGKLVAVGTTSLRTLESLYWLGARMMIHHLSAIPELGQWDPYELPALTISARTSLQFLLDFLIKKKADRVRTKTRIIMAPGYTTRLADALITNFHQPRSTLLLLIAALTGSDWKRIYHYALDHDFRFLSYGDGCLLWIKKETTADSSATAIRS